MTMNEICDRKPELSGVGSWLLFLCITLIVLLPLRVAVSVWALLTMPGLVEPLLFAMVVGFPLLGIAGGVLLYREQLLGLRLVQIFLGLQVAFGTLTLIGGGGGRSTILPMLTAAAWLAYTLMSERVRIRISNPVRRRTMSFGDRH